MSSQYRFIWLAEASSLHYFGASCCDSLNIGRQATLGQGVTPLLATISATIHTGGNRLDPGPELSYFLFLSTDRKSTSLFVLGVFR